MPLSRNEIKTRAIVFTDEWKDKMGEDAEAEFFQDDSLMCSEFAWPVNDNQQYL